MTFDLPAALGLLPFRPRWPWLSGDLQTLRDSLRPVNLPPDTGRPLLIPVGDGARLLAMLDPAQAGPHGLVLLLHGLGGSSSREGLRRMGLTLQHAGFAVLRLNLRGAGAGRELARGTYAAACNRDLLPVIQRARQLAEQLAPGGRPLLGVGISLGGTMLLNAVLGGAALDGLVCISSPLDLEACSRQIERPRNRLYQHWLLRRLVQQTLADPFGVSASERAALGSLGSIRAFDAAITAPRWGYNSVDDYYRRASPLQALLAAAGQRGEDGLESPCSLAALPPSLIVHAADDPWVPVAACERLLNRPLPTMQSSPTQQPVQLLITPQGGHNGFHGRCDHPARVARSASGPSPRSPSALPSPGNWGDRLTARWLLRLVTGSVDP